MFVLLMLFLFKYIDDLIGKGFEWYIILELLFYASATNVAMALPLAMLLSSIMTFGSLGENYELVAIKSAGISLQKAMRPLIVLVMLLSAAAFLFSDYMLPVANLKMGSLLYDVRNQKSAFFIKEGVFNSSIPGYSIRVKSKDENGNLYKVVIYEHSNGGANVLMADEGKMYRTADDHYLVLKLKNGVRYEESAAPNKPYNPRQRFMRYYFKETEQKFDLSGFKMQRTDEDLFKSNYAMLNMKQLKYYRDSTEALLDTNLKFNSRDLFSTIRFFNNYLPKTVLKDTAAKAPKNYKTSVLELIPPAQRHSTILNAQNEISSVETVVTAMSDQSKDYKTRIRRYIIEYQRKITLAAACLVLFSIGAPLGAIIRKGGLGLPVVMSIIFFLIYHIISTIGEKSAREGSLSPILGMWIALIVLAPLGVFLTYKAAADSALFDIDSYKQLFQKTLRRIFKKKASA